MVYKKYPELIKVMANRHNMYNETTEYIKEQEKSGNILVIRPEKPLPVNHVEHNADALEFAYQLGRQAGENNLGEIKSFIQ